MNQWAERRRPGGIVERDGESESKRAGHHPRQLCSAGLSRALRRVIYQRHRIRDIAQTSLRVFFQATPQQTLRFLRHSIPLRFIFQHGGQGVGGRLAGKRGRACKHLVEHDAEGPDIGPAVDRLAASLLRTHVGLGAQDHTGAGRRNGERFPFLTLAALYGQSEVEDFHHARGRNHDVGRLQVAMSDAFIMGGVQSLGNLPGIVERRLDGQRTFESLARN